jgi:hypothetical protein
MLNHFSPYCKVHKLIPFSAADVQMTNLSNAMETVINFLPNLFLVFGDDDRAAAKRPVQDLRQNLAKLILQVSVEIIVV